MHFLHFCVWLLFLSSGALDISVGKHMIIDKKQKQLKYSEHWKTSNYYKDLQMNQISALHNP